MILIRLIETLVIFIPFYRDSNNFSFLYRDLNNFIKTLVNLVHYIETQVSYNSLYRVFNLNLLNKILIKSQIISKFLKSQFTQCFPDLRVPSVDRTKN